MQNRAAVSKVTREEATEAGGGLKVHQVGVGTSTRDSTTLVRAAMFAAKMAGTLQCLESGWLTRASGETSKVPVNSVLNY